MPRVLRLASQSSGINVIATTAVALEWLAAATPPRGLSKSQCNNSLSITHTLPTAHPAKPAFLAPCFLVGGRFVLGIIVGPVYSPLLPPSVPPASRPLAARFVLDLTEPAIIEVRMYEGHQAVYVAHAGNRKEYVLSQEVATIASSQSPARIEVKYERDPTEGEEALHLSSEALQSWQQFVTNYESYFPSGPLLARSSTSFTIANNNTDQPNYVSSQPERVLVVRHDPKVEEYSFRQELPRRVVGPSQSPRRLLPRPPQA